MTESPTIDNRALRIFVSSTFRDMHAERDELLKYVFPKLRHLCERRGVTFSDVDLRWGVTDEEAAEGKVLPICLAEIERCRPFFIGMLGQRYGWVPEAIPNELLESWSWLGDHLQQSVTELEILHGVLNTPTMRDRAFFYFRDPCYLERIPDGRRDDYLDRDPAADRKLESLKERIRQSGSKVRENYPDPEIFGQWVLDDLTETIERLYPLEESPGLLEKQAREHEAFARGRRDVYIGRREYFEELDDFAGANDEDEILVVQGDSGGGKSALLSNWIEHFSQQHPDDHPIVHFIGTATGSGDLYAMFRRLLGEIHARYEIDEPLPDDPKMLEPVFMAVFRKIAGRRRLVLVLDALNQLDDRDDVFSLHWLPRSLPGNVRLIVSTLPGKALDSLEERNCRTLVIKPLEIPERKELIVRFLARFSKKLNDRQTERITTTAQASQPLFLRALVDELRLFGIHEKLEERIDYYLEAADTADLYSRILDRWSEDYEIGRPGLVRDVMTLLWTAPRGLSESELLTMLGEIGAPLPQAYWSPLSLAAEQSLMVHTGRIGFFHDHIREAVRRKYLDNPESVYRKHDEAANFCMQAFQEKDDTLLDYAMHYLPTHLIESRRWDDLAAVLCDLNFLESKASAGLVFELAEDFKSAVVAMPEEHPKRRVLDLLERALRRDLHFIARHIDDYPQALFQCLWNSCWWYDTPLAARYYIEPKDGWDTENAPWLREKSLRLQTLLESWLRLKSEQSVVGQWLRSRRPPNISLDSPQTAVFQGHEDEVQGLAFSPDGLFLASFDNSDTVKTWHVQSGAERCSVNVGFSIDDLVFSPDGRTIIARENVCEKKFYHIAILDAETLDIQRYEHFGFYLPRERHPYEVHPHGDFTPEKIIFAKDVPYLKYCIGHHVAGKQDPHECLYNRSGEGGFYCAAFSADDRYAAGASTEQNVYVWDLETGGEIAFLQGHRDKISCLDFTHDAKKLLTGSHDHTLRLWELETGREIRSFDVGAPTCNLAFTDEDHTVIVRTDNRLVVVDFESFTVLNGFVVEYELERSGEDDPADYSYSALKEEAYFSNGKIRILDGKTNRLLYFLPSREKQDNDVSPDGRYEVFTTQTSCVYLKDKTSDKDILPLRGHHDRIWAVVFSPDGRFIASGSKDKTIRIWDIHRNLRKEIPSCPEHDYRIMSVAASPGLDRIVTGGEDNTVRIYDTETGHHVLRLYQYQPTRDRNDNWLNPMKTEDELLRFIEDNLFLAPSGFTSATWDVAYSPDGTRIAVSYNDIQ